MNRERTLTRYYGVHTDPGHRAVQPLEHDDVGRRYRHAFQACLLEAGHAPATFTFDPLGQFHPDLRVWWEVPGQSFEWSKGQVEAWWAAAKRAEALCAPLLPGGAS